MITAEVKYAKSGLEKVGRSKPFVWEANITFTHENGRVETFWVKGYSWRNGEFWQEWAVKPPSMVFFTNPDTLKGTIKECTMKAQQKAKPW